MSSTGSDRSLFGRLFAPVTEASRLGGPAGSSTPDRLRALEQDLEALAARAREMERQRAESRGAAVAAFVSDREAPEAAKRRFLEERARARGSLEKDIESMHARLGTGLGDEAVRHRLSSILAEHMRSAQIPAVGLTAQIEAHTLRHLFARAGERAWDRLEELMTAAGVAWPVLPDLTIGHDSRELGAIRAQRRAELLDLFLKSPPADTAELIHGEVKAWPLAYPQRGGERWTEIVLRGVASALRAHVFATAIEQWLWRPAQLDEDLRRMLERELEGCATLLKAGVRSLDEAARVQQRVDDLARTVVPEHVWDYVVPNLGWEHPQIASGDALPGASVTDPVCGMVLTPERVAARAQHDGTSYAFCSTACWTRFTQDPKTFGA